MQTSLDFAPVVHPFSAIELAEGGMQVAIDNANRKVDGWADKAAVLLDEWLLICTTKFLTEDFRFFAETRGLEAPPHARAYGPVIRRACTDKKVVPAGYAKTTNPKAHGTPATLWIKA